MSRIERSILRSARRKMLPSTFHMIQYAVGPIFRNVFEYMMICVNYTPAAVIRCILVQRTLRDTTDVIIGWTIEQDVSEVSLRWCYFLYCLECDFGVGGLVGSGRRPIL